METTRYPLDFEALNKGDMIPIGKIEAITGERLGTEAYSFAAFRLAQRIMQRLSDDGRPVIVRRVGGALEILTDEKAVPHNDKGCVAGLQKAVRSHRRQGFVDVGKLSDDTKLAHERSLIVNGKMIQGAISGRKDGIKLIAHKRNVPTIENKEPPEAGDAVLV